MSAPTTSRMRIERVEASKHKRGRVLVFLEDGVCLKITEQELLDFGLRAGDELDTKTLDRLKEAAGVSNVKATAADLIGKRAMSRASLEKKLKEKGASEADARYAAEWLEAIGAINDADKRKHKIRFLVAYFIGPWKTNSFQFFAYKAFTTQVRRHAYGPVKSVDSGLTLWICKKSKLNIRFHTRSRSCHVYYTLFFIHCSRVFL